MPKPDKFRLTWKLFKIVMSQNRPRYWSTVYDEIKRLFFSLSKESKVIVTIKPLRLLLAIIG